MNLHPRTSLREAVLLIVVVYQCRINMHARDKLEQVFMHLTRFAVIHCLRGVFCQGFFFLERGHKA